MNCHQRSAVMSDEAGHEPARDPQDLARLLVSRERTGDVDGMAALYEPHRLSDNLFEDAGSIYSATNLFATLGYASAGHRRMSAPK
jgi:hypothetical protein